MVIKKRRINMNKMIVRFTIVFVLVFAINLAVRSSASGLSYDSYLEIPVAQGDTLWDLSKQHAQGENIQKVILKVMEINNMETCDIYPGQVIKMPVKF